MFGYSKITSVSWMPGIWGYVQVASSKDQGFAQYDNILLVLSKCFYLAVSFSWWCMYFAAVTCFCLLDYVFLFLVGRRFVQYLLHVCHLALVFLNRTATTEVFFHFCCGNGWQTKSHMPPSLLLCLAPWIQDLMVLLDTIVLEKTVDSPDEEPRLKIWKRSLQICCNFVSRHRKHMDK
jgi:hypothetical protein